MARFCIHLVSLAAIFFVDHSIVCGFTINGMDVVLKSFTDCEDQSSLKLEFKNLILSQVGKNKFVVAGDAKLDVEITDDIRAEVKVTRCDDSTGEDSCEFMGVATGDKFCEKIGKDGSPWNSFMKQTEFGTSCPIKPGKYTVNNASVEVQDADGITLSPGYWKLRMEVFNVADATNPIGCNVAEVSVDVAKGGY